MYSIVHMNILMESIGIAIMLTVLGLLSVGGNRESRQSRLFMSFVLINTALLVSDLVSWLLVGNTAPFSLFAARAAVFVCFCTTAIAGVVFSEYIIALVGEKASVSKNFSRIIYALCVVNIVMLAVSQYNDMYYYFDENNMYRVGELFWVNEAFGFLILLLLSALILRHRKSLGINDTLFALSYELIILVAGLMQSIVNSELELSFIGTTVSVIAIYGGIQVRRERLFREMELKLAESRIAIMLSQIQPHFLYNSLTAIRRLCQTDPKTAEETVVEFTKYLRGNIDALSLKITIPFEKELEHTRCYLAIEQKRFGKKVRIVYDIAASGFNLPALTLQPIVENAVRYGITKREEGGTVTICSYDTDTAHVVSVKDDGVGFDAGGKPGGDGGGPAGRDRMHVGIENVRSRLAAMCGGGLSVESRPGVGTTAIITIPKVSLRET